MSTLGEVQYQEKKLGDIIAEQEGILALTAAGVGLAGRPRPGHAGG